MAAKIAVTKRKVVNWGDCSICGTPVKIRQHVACSKECASIARSRSWHKIKPGNYLPTGSAHRLWKGGIRRPKRDPIKDKARRMVEKAIKHGVLVRLPCSVCGNVKSEGHHKDYLKPLDVEWLCRIHHRQADYRDNTKAGDFGH